MFLMDTNVTKKTLVFMIWNPTMYKLLTSFLATIVTFAPHLASCTANDLPIPLDPPVTYIK